MEQFKWQVATLMATYAPRTVQRCLVTTLGGYFPVAALAPNGDLCTIVRGGDYHVGPRGWLDLVRSSDGGHSWSRPERVAGEGLDNRNPAFGILRDGTMLLAYAEAGCYREGTWDGTMDAWRFWYTRSTDGGRTWAPRRPLPSASGYRLSSPFGKIVELPDGTALMPVYATTGEGYDPKAYRWENDRSLVMISKDKGLSWVEPHAISSTPLNETGLCCTRQGDLVAVARQERIGCLFALRSADGGRTWSEPRQITGAREHPADVIELASGSLLVVFGRRRFPMGVGAALSRDAGRTWSAEREVMLVGDSRSGDCGYPSSVQRADGKIVTLYYSIDCLHVPSWGNHCGAVIYEERDLGL
jgi:hypothetical protein